MQPVHTHATSDVTCVVIRRGKGEAHALLFVVLAVSSKYENMPQVLSEFVCSSQFFVFSLFANEREGEVVLVSMKGCFNGVRVLHVVFSESIKKHKRQALPLVVHHRLQTIKHALKQ